MEYSKNTKSPQGNELEAPFGELIVAGCPLLAARADCGRTLARSYDHFDALLIGTEAGLLVDETPEAVAAVQDGGQFHGAKASSGETSTINRQDLSPRTADYERSAAPKSGTPTSRQNEPAPSMTRQAGAIHVAWLRVDHARRLCVNLSRNEV
jgi:hypothetical protein